MKVETLAVRAGREIDAASGAVAPPINLSTTFERAPDGSYPRGYIYTRSNNPNRAALEAACAKLEGGASAAVFASGSAATYAVFQALSPGAHVIAPADIYYGTKHILQSLLGRWGLETSFVDMTDADAVEQAVRSNTKLLWVETPSNPRLKISDIGRAAEIAHKAGALLACDNTWATPVLQRPLEFGADLVMHSTTKYLGGHSDALGGCVIAKAEDEIVNRVRDFQTAGGAVPSPFDCWLVLRSIPTLPLRVRAQSENAGRIAEFLSGHKRVRVVHYPGLRTNSTYELAARQMQGFGGMLSFEVEGGSREAMEVAAKVKLIVRATSLGGVESSIEHRASIEGKDSTTPQNLLRLSVGLEHVEDLIEDLDQALG
ncbi:MAG: aminotransferase class I/II-fold pyridoxal phosphate-dependent enzyme [Pyrinomonadaceae bacterium]|nr:aminotransferase class I/II-fold pyridoxal phosphate-dependent enzyme [Pyrinomonadaceae bacterium]